MLRPPPSLTAFASPTGTSLKLATRVHCDIGWTISVSLLVMRLQGTGLTTCATAFDFVLWQPYCRRPDVSSLAHTAFGSSPVPGEIRHFTQPFLQAMRLAIRGRCRIRYGRIG